MNCLLIILISLVVIFSPLLLTSIFFGLPVYEASTAPFKGCRFVSQNHKGCPGKQKFLRYRSSLTGADGRDQVDILDIETLCCNTVEHAMAASKDLQIASMVKNLDVLNNRLGLKSKINSEIN